MSNRSSVDERTSAPSEASRRGAHRARPKAVPSGLPIIAGVAVILLVIGGAYYGLRDTSVTSTGTVSGAGADTGASASASASAGASAGASTGATAGAEASTAPKASASSPATATRTQAPVTKNVQVVVLNSVSVQGLAARAKATLVAQSWNVTKTDNSTQKNLSTSVVYYGRSNLRATARQVVKDLGYGQISYNTQVVSGAKITVVLGQDAV